VLRKKLTGRGFASPCATALAERRASATPTYAFGRILILALIVAIACAPKAPDAPAQKPAEAPAQRADAKIETKYIAATRGATVPVYAKPDARGTTGDAIGSLAHGTRVEVEKWAKGPKRLDSHFYYMIWDGDTPTEKYVLEYNLSDSMPAALPPIIGYWRTNRHVAYAWNFSEASPAKRVAFANVFSFYGSYGGNWDLSGNILTVKNLSRLLADGETVEYKDDVIARVEFVNADSIIFYHQDGTTEKLFRTDEFGISKPEQDNPRPLVVPKGVTHINGWEYERGGYGFITLPGSLTSIEAGAFAHNELASVIIPDSVTYIGHSAFTRNYLRSVAIGKGIRSINERVFYGNFLESVAIPDSVHSIESEAFAHNHLASIEIPDSVIAIKAYAFADNALTSIVIPDSVISIGDDAFARNKLRTAVIGKGVRHIGDVAFMGSPLRTITISKDVTLGKSAFEYDFPRFYNENGRKAGTYTFKKDGKWSMED
jgi:hypothetical protein